MYETKNEPPLSRSEFAQRLVRHWLAASALLIASLFLGMIGYVVFEHLSWTDAFLNTSMLLGGMGPVNLPQSQGGKVFAGCFALYAGLVFIVTAALLLTPMLHRLVHRFHFDDES